MFDRPQPPASDSLEQLLENAGVDASQISPLARFGKLVLEANRSFNLTGATSESAIVAHIVDSLTIVRYVSGRHVDVGSGGGFPGIPIAIATGLPVTLIEATRKKARFLESAAASLSLCVQVVSERAETAARSERLRDSFSSGTARAVSSAPAVAELLLPFIEPGGIAILQRGTMDENERCALTDAALVLGGEMEREDPVGQDNRIVIVRKRHKTPVRFPRRAGIPQKRPLCTHEGDSVSYGTTR